jgi:hypothetical protein
MMSTGFRSGLLEDVRCGDLLHETSFYQVLKLSERDDLRQVAERPAENFGMDGILPHELEYVGWHLEAVGLKATLRDPDPLRALGR